MPKIPLKPQGQEFQLRPGSDPLGGAGWRGVNTESDPGSLNPNELQWGENLRHRGKGWITRPGMSQVLDLGLGLSNGDNSVLWMHEAPADNPRARLWLSARGCFGAAIGTGSLLANLDPTQVPVVQNYGQFYTASDFQIPMGRYGDKLLMGDRSELREVIVSTAPAGVKADRLLLSPSQVPLASFPGFVIRCLQEFDNKLFIGLENTAVIAASKISAWNGVSAIDDLTGVRPPLALGLWRDKLVAGFDVTAGNIQVRPAGAVPTAWVAFAVGGFLCSSHGNAMAEEKQYLYIASGTDLIHRFDGAALTLQRTIAGCAVDGFGCTALTLHNGLLYYGWNTPGAAYLSRIGRHDPESTTVTEWLDSYKDVTADQANFISLTSLLSYRRQIFAGGRQMWVVGTAVNDVKGTIEVYNNTGAPGAGFQVEQLYRFP